MEAADRLLSRIDELAPQLKPRAAEFEAARRIPRDVIETLRAVGVFRMVVPQSHGGLEMDMPGVVRVFSALGRIEGSLGWTIGIGSVSAVFATLLPRTTYDRVYSASPDIIIAGSNLPLGEATPTEDGWRIHGRWPFVTGCQHADWILARCVVKENGAGPIVEGATHPAPPIHRSFMLPAREWQIDETWDVPGLKGTGSHHVPFGDRLVENGHLYDPVGGKPCVSGPLYQAITPLLSVAHGAVCVGIAQGALDAIVELAPTRRQQFPAPT